jgi:hypothetical protein
MSRKLVGIVLISGMAFFTMLGSISGLIHYAEGGQPGVIDIGGAHVPTGTIAFVAGLDGLAAALTVLAHQKGKTDWLAFGGLLAATAASTALQVAAVWGDAQAVIVHGLPAPCTGVAAGFLLHSLNHAPDEALPPPPVVHASGGPSDVASTSGSVAQAAPPPAPEVPPAPAGAQQRPPTSRAKRATSGAGGRPTQPKLEGDELLRAVALRLIEAEQTLTVRNVEGAVKATRGSCSRTLRDSVYAALSEPDALGLWAEAAVTPDSKEGD